MSSQIFHDEGPAKEGKKLFLATPCYDSPDASYTYAMARSREALREAGFQTAYFLLRGNCHVDDARNVIVRHFRESDCDELVFLDADVTWEPQGIVQLARRDCDMVGGVYSFRGGGRENMPMRLLNAEFPDKNGMLEMDGLPTGFLKIKRVVFDRLEPHVPWYWDKTERTPQFFARSINPDDHQRWGGDIEFCRKWREIGGRLYADTEIRLGHVGKIVYWDSLAAYFRRLHGIAFDHLIPIIRDGAEVMADYDELFQALNNPFAAGPDVMALMVGLARQCRAPIIETGSGLTSVLMAAANPSIEVHSLEHDAHYAEQTRALARTQRVSNLTVHCAPLVDGWYDLNGLERGKFGVGLCDGPPRKYGTRMRFFDHIASRCKVIVADDVGTDWRYAAKVTEWAGANGKQLTMLGRAALLR